MVGCLTRLVSLRSASATSKLRSILRLMAAGESAAASGAGRAGFRARARRARALLPSGRLGVLDEMYSVRRRKDTLASATLGLPRAAMGLRSARS